MTLKHVSKNDSSKERKREREDGHAKHEVKKEKYLRNMLNCKNLWNWATGSDELTRRREN